MIINKEVLIFVTNKTINYYRDLGYQIKPNDYNIIKVEHLMKYSMVKVDVKCEICDKESKINYQKYTKNISKHNIYTCVKCSHIKNKKTYKEIFGKENYVNVDALRQTVKEKYDRITEEHELKGYINCIKCLQDRDLSEYLVKNGRYKHICRLCRNQRTYYNRNKSPHIKAWRSILRGVLSRIDKKKKDKTHHLLKYSSEELKHHMCKLFTEGMSWENYGQWHIDHIVHVSLFKDDAPIHIVNELSNLRPLQAKLNIARHNNLDEDCLNSIEKYKTYIKEEYIKLIKN
jgi:hypothetical protein